MDIYLKADDEETMISILFDAGILELLDDDFVPAIGVSYDEIGVITTFDSETETTTELPGWHVNLKVGGLTEEQQSILDPFIITPPTTPYRVWF